MCGVAGYLRPGGGPVDRRRVSGMLASIRRRGPDDEGLCLISRHEGTVCHMHTDRSVPAWRAATPHLHASGTRRHDLALMNTRYAVIDRSDAAHQPLALDDDEVVVSFQGEIFNYLELRRELETAGIRFRTRSDTEVLAQAYRVWGAEAWDRLNGLWAAALYDARTGTLLLCRDRLGIAPLHFAESEEGIWFGSSVLGVARACFGAARPAREPVSDFLRTGLRNVDERTLVAGVTSLPPGTFLSFPRSATRLAEARSVRYWDLPGARLGADQMSLEEGATLLRETLADAVAIRLRTELDLAFQLSGGLDSTTVVALASALRDDALPTYTVSVPEEDEEPLVRRMEDRFLLERRTLDSGAGAFADQAAAFARLMEEPVQAPGAYGHHRMCLAMREDGFGVTLSGSGGDEVLAGYEWDFWPAARRLLVRDGRWLQAGLHHLFVRLGTPRRAWGALVYWGKRLGLGAGRTGDGGTMETADPRSAGSPLSFDERCRFHIRVADLPYYLASNDRATLGIPLEHRQPFLDHRVVELGLRMPVAHLFRGGWTKFVLRKAMQPLLPPEILWRREKSGFPFPTRRLLERARPQLESACRRVDQAGLTAEPRTDYAELLLADPLGLWRRCSVGLWLDVLGG